MNNARLLQSLGPDFSLFGDIQGFYFHPIQKKYAHDNFMVGVREDKARKQQHKKTIMIRMYYYVFRIGILS